MAGRIGYAAASLSAAVLLLSMSAPHPGAVMVAAIWSVAVLSAMRPFDGLLVLAGLGPVVTALAIALRADDAGVHFPEALTLAFIAGASARRAFSGSPASLPRRILWPTIVLIALGVASALVNATMLITEQDESAPAVRMAWSFVLNHLASQNTVTVAVLFVEGLVLFVLAAAVAARVPNARARVLRLMVAGATGAAALNTVRIVMAALQKERALPALLDYLAHARVSVQYSDWNAAGSFFGMVLIAALAFVTRRRSGYAACAAVIALGLWLTGSRVAMAAVLLTMIAAGIRAGYRAQTERRLLALVAVGFAIAATIAGVLWYPAVRNDPVMYSVSTRFELWKAGVQMMATAPFFGVGLGRFYELSPQYASATLQTIWRPHENAHNYFIQILAELGIPGLVLFVTITARALRHGWRTAQPPPSRFWVAGPFVFLVTCLTGHPFLVPEAAVPFWIVLGLAAFETSSVPSAPAGSRLGARTVVAGIVLLIAATVPIRMREAVRHANTASAARGLSAWQQERGVRYRWAESRAAFFVPSGARLVRLPMRAGPDAPPALVVSVSMDGREANRVELHAGDDWREVRLMQPARRPLPDFLRIEIDASVPGASGASEPAGARVLMLAQPSLVWQR
jgi:O-antigen ligase